MDFQDRVDVLLGRGIFRVELNSPAEGPEGLVELFLVAEEEAELVVSIGAFWIEFDDSGKGGLGLVGLVLSQECKTETRLGNRRGCGSMAMALRNAATAWSGMF